MAGPPRDKDGFVEPHDDEDAIPSDTFVVRYVRHDQLKDNLDGSKTPSSAAFSGSSKKVDRYEGMSVDIVHRLEESGVDQRTRMLDISSDFVGGALLQAGKLRVLGLKVGPDPMQSGDHFHASVWGVENRHRKKVQRSWGGWLVDPADNAG